jgi:hypothetical protein
MNLFKSAFDEFSTDQLLEDDEVYHPFLYMVVNLKN